MAQRKTVKTRTQISWFLDQFFFMSLVLFYFFNVKQGWQIIKVLSEESLCHKKEWGNSLTQNSWMQMTLLSGKQKESGYITEERKKKS